MRQFLTIYWAPNYLLKNVSTVEIKLKKFNVGLFFPSGTRFKKVTNWLYGSKNSTLPWRKSNGEELAYVCTCEYVQEHSFAWGKVHCCWELWEFNVTTHRARFIGVLFQYLSSKKKIWYLRSRKKINYSLKILLRRPFWNIWLCRSSNIETTTRKRDGWKWESQ